jgi:hypothetical protein
MQPRQTKITRVFAIPEDQRIQRRWPMASNLRPPCLVRWEGLIELQFCEMWRPLDVGVPRVSQAGFREIRRRKREPQQAHQFANTRK